MKISELSFDKIDKYEFFTGVEILPSDQSRIIEQAKFTYSPLSKVFGKQIKIIEDQGIKQVEALKTLKSQENKQDIKSIKGTFPKDMKTYEIKKWEKEMKQKDFKNETKKYTYDFQQ